jgi:hypothetical protein
MKKEKITEERGCECEDEDETNPCKIKNGKKLLLDNGL